MSKFVTISSVFLAWAFFEESGGFDFVPASQREVTTQVVDEDVESSFDFSFNYVPFDQPIVTRVEQPAATRIDQPVVTRAASESPEAVVIQASAGTQTTVQTYAATQNQTAINPAASKPAAKMEPSIRAISGEWVNVREGPGTQFGVVETLQRGTRVELVDTNDNDWAQVRLLDGGKVVWVAAWLLAD